MIVKALARAYFGGEADCWIDGSLRSDPVPRVFFCTRYFIANPLSPSYCCLSKWKEGLGTKGVRQY